jgi:FimV-like protein
MEGSMLFRLILILVIAFGCIVPIVGAAQEDDALLPGIALYETGKYQEAYRFFFELFLQTPQSRSINIRLGQAAAAAGDHEAAVMAFERVLIIDPEAVEMKLELAKAFRELGSSGIAAEYLDELVEAGLPEEIRSQARELRDEIRSQETR